MELQVHGYELTLRLDDAAQIEVELIDSRSRKHEGPKKISNTAHPGLGEEGKYHVKGSGNPLPDGEKLTYALVGNQNCGKTTLFNAYTGSRQHVGHYPGVTVARKAGTISVDNTPVTLVDLPGTYSLTAYSQEELVARDELSLGRVDAVIDCADASALERNMLLTVQMMEMGMPVVLACNMMDEARKAGIHIDMQKLSEQLGTPVLPIVARNGEGIREVARAALDLAKKGRKEPLHINYGPELTEAVEALEKRLSEEKILIDRYHPHWTALKLLEGDTKVQESVREARPDLAPEILSYCEGIEEKVKAATQATCESVITDARYGYIRGLLAQGVVKQDPGKDRLALSDRLDKILTNRFLGPLIMIGVLYLMFVITFNLGAYPQEWLEDFFAWMGSELGDHMDDGLLKCLVCDGIMAGVGGVVSFVPLIAIMFALIAFIEDSGYMARIAYMMDRIFRFFGLHGASVMPYIIAGGIAGGCAIPGVMATRTLRAPKEKLATLLTLPFGIGSFIVGLFYAPTVVTGIHQMYTAIDLGQLAQYGVTYWLPIASAANIAQGGAALAVAFKTRDAKIKGLALPSALSAFMGITEPAIFGVNLRFFKPFIAGCIGGGCGALVCALTSLAASGTGVTGIFGILLRLSQPVQYAIMFAVAALVSFGVSFVLYKDEPKASEQA